MWLFLDHAIFKTCMVEADGKLLRWCNAFCWKSITTFSFYASIISTMNPCLITMHNLCIWVASFTLYNAFFWTCLLSHKKTLRLIMIFSPALRTTTLFKVDNLRFLFFLSLLPSALKLERVLCPLFPSQKSGVTVLCVWFAFENARGPQSGLQIENNVLFAIHGREHSLF